jgi:hypothetical protein
LTIITKITKIGPITTEAGNYRGIQVVLKDFRTYYFCSIPFTSIRKPKVLEFCYLIVIIELLTVRLGMCVDGYLLSGA